MFHVMVQEGITFLVVAEEVGISWEGGGVTRVMVWASRGVIVVVVAVGSLYCTAVVLPPLPPARTLPRLTPFPCLCLHSRLVAGFPLASSTPADPLPLPLPPQSFGRRIPFGFLDPD